MDALFRSGAPGWPGVGTFASSVWASDIYPRDPPSSYIVQLLSSASGFVSGGLAYATSQVLGMPAPPPVQAPLSRTDAVIRRQATLLGVSPEIIRSPLPVDTTRGIVLMPQLLGSWGPDLQHFASVVATVGGPQEGNVIICSAASGIGKTHLAYAWGVQFGSSIIGQVITSDLCGDIAPPFALLLTQLRPLLTVPPGHDDAVATAAFLFVRLALLSFVHFSVLSLRALRATHPEVSTGDLRQVLLRMHRNGKTDALVTDIFKTLLARLRVKKWQAQDTDIFALDPIALDDYETSLSIAATDTMGSVVLLTVDEAHELMRRRECDGVASLFLSQRAEGGTSSVGRVSAFPAPRSLFYAVVHELSRLRTVHGWSVYVTGTALSMRRVLESSSASIATRCHPIVFAPEHRLGVPDIILILCNYWAIDDVLADPTVCQRLRDFVGRPQLFVAGVFRPLFVFVHEKRRLPTALEFVELLNNSFRTCVLERKLFFLKLLEGNSTVAVDGAGTMAFLPLLFRAAVMDDGVITLRNDDHLAAAICTGLLAVSSAASPGTVNMRDEPIIYESIRAAMLDTVQEWRVLDVLMRSSQSTPVFAKGGALEIAISWHVALMCTRVTDPSLADVLQSLGVERRHIPPDCAAWVVRATRVHNDDLGQGHEAGEITPFQRYFFKADGSINDSQVVYNIPAAQGGDIALLVSRIAPVEKAGVADRSGIIGGRQYRPVIFQCKNEEHALTVAKTLLTLHPGTQFLQNWARERLLRLPHRAFPDAVQKGWCEWEALSRDDRRGFLTRNWVRIAVVARPLDDKIPDFSLAAAVTDDRDAYVRSWSVPQFRLAALSPIVWVSLAKKFIVCEGVFPDSVRRAIIANSNSADDSAGEAAGAPRTGAGGAQPKRSLMMLVHHQDLWVPASVGEAAQLVDLLAVEASESASSEASAAGSKRRRGADRGKAAPEASKK